MRKMATLAVSFASMLPSNSITTQCKFACVALLFAMTCCHGCKKSDAPSTAATTTNPEHVKPASASPYAVPTLLLAKAQFKVPQGTSNTRYAIPGPALVTVLQRIDGTWTESKLTDSKCIVFHKAQFIDVSPIGGRVLTIGGTEARLSAWESDGKTWNSELIWNPTFGGAFDRLRDFEVGDIDGDGNNDIVIGTHDQGVVAVVSHVDGAWRVNAIDRAPRTIIHEIELGDTDGDGQYEIFATPSQPNNATLVSQPGRIVQYRFDGTKIQKRAIADLKDTHCKEILAVDINQDGKDELIAAVEARTELLGGKLEIIEPVQIVLFRESGGQFNTETIAQLPDRMCRVLCAGDIDGNGRTDIIATGMQSGVWWLRPTEKVGWTLESVDRNSSGIEHAATLADFDNTGRDSIFVASEREGELREYTRTGSAFASTVIAELNDNQLTFSITATMMPKIK